MINIYIRKYKNFLPIEYVDRKNKENKKRINIYIWFMVLLNIIICVEVSKENNSLEKMKNELVLNEMKNERCFAEELINKTKEVRGLLNNHLVISAEIERGGFNIKTYERNLHLVMNEINKANGSIVEMIYDEASGTNTIKGEFR